MNWLKNIFAHPKEFFDSIKTIVIAVFFALIFRSVVAAPYKIPTGSMIPTLKIGDFIFVSKLSYGLKIPFTNYNLMDFDKPLRGDIVVFMFPENKDVDFIKRIVAVEGDVLEVKNDALHINGKEIPRKPITDRSILSDVKKPEQDSRVYREALNGVDHVVIEFLPYADDFGPITVPPGHVFVMGDNRDNSKDSRAWGPLPMKNIRGRSLFVWLSIDSAKWRIRWERFGMKIK